MLKELWAIKYRPNTIENYIFQSDAHKAQVLQFIKDQDFPHLLLYGHHGTGKTTLGLLLKDALGVEDMDFLQLNSSKDNSVDIIRNKVATFSSTIATGPFKLILFDEAHRLTPPAQDALRAFLEDPQVSLNMRVIFTANHLNNLTVELRSRLLEIKYTKLDKELMLEKVGEILSKEKIKVTSIELLESYIDMAYPDFRKITSLLQANSRTGILQQPTEVDESAQYNIEILELLEAGQWEAIRDLVCKTVDGDDFIAVYKFIYSYIHEVGKFKNEDKYKQAIIVIADHLYRHAFSADAEINFTACIIRLTEI